MSQSSGLTDQQARRAVADVLGFTPSDPNSMHCALCSDPRWSWPEQVRVRRR